MDGRLENRFTREYGLRHPIVLTPMAFVGTAPPLAIAVCQAGGLGALAAGPLPPDALRKHDLRVIAPDRPGYGGSSPQPGRSINDWPADVAALADALRIERFLVASHSSGGPYAVVCAALIPERVFGAAVVAVSPTWRGRPPGRDTWSAVRRSR